MSSARCRGVQAWAALGCCALFGVACNVRPSEAPRSPAQKLDAPPPPPETPAEEPSSELDALDYDILQANKQLEAQLQRKQSAQYRAEQSELERDKKPSPAKPPGAGKKKQPSGSEGIAGGTVEKPPDLTPDDDEEGEATDQPVGVRGSPCDLACRALHSMERSATRICALAGESSERCLKAKRTVERATKRVRDAGCRCTDVSQELMSRLAPRSSSELAACAPGRASNFGGEER